MQINLKTQLKWMKHMLIYVSFLTKQMAITTNKNNLYVRSLIFMDYLFASSQKF
jgi:hypothetical protein